MIISAGRRAIFVHIPKTGGTAMALALEVRAMRDDILIGDTPKAQRRKARLAGVQTTGRLWKHSRLADVVPLISPAQMADWCVFTLVRNPWDRMVSYYHWLRDQSFDHPAVTTAKAHDFSGFLNAQQTQRSLLAQPYAAYTTDASGVNHVDHLIRLEHWRQDLRPVWDHLGFTFDLPQANASARPPDYRSCYTDADAALIARLCAADIAQSGYRFDL